MKSWLKWTGLVLLAAALGLALAFAFTAIILSPRRAEVITLDQAAESARQYLVDYGNPALGLTEVMEFWKIFTPRSRSGPQVSTHSSC